MKKSNVIWGVILLTLGVLLILRNTGVIYFSLHSVIRLWPLIFIFWGIAVLPVKGFIKLILSAITIIGAFIILSQYPSEEYHWFRWHSHENNNWSDEDEDIRQQQHISESYDSAVSHVRLNLDAAAGKFFIKNQTSELYEIDNEGGFGTYKAKTNRDKNSATIDIRQTDQHIRRGTFKNNVWLALNPDPVWDLNIEVGAAGLEMDVTPFRIERIDIKGGASSIQIRIGELSRSTKVNIDAGASSIDIKIPTASGCEIHTNTVLSARDIEGFEKTESGIYRTSNYSTAENTIVIEVDAAVSSLSVNRY